MTNVRWGTPESNRADKMRHGTQVKGESVNTAKICAEDVRRVRREGYPLRPHALRLNVSEALISSILRGRIWKHVQ